MCDTQTIMADNIGWGVIQSQSYPKWSKDKDCTLNITTNDPTKSIRFYLSDIQIQSQFNTESCPIDSLQVGDGSSSETYCGGISNLETYSYATCSNTLTISYKTNSGNAFTAYLNRGFSGYYECKI